jgi:hypothetical protein
MKSLTEFSLFSANSYCHHEPTSARAPLEFVHVILSRLSTFVLVFPSKPFGRALGLRHLVSLGWLD